MVQHVHKISMDDRIQGLILHFAACCVEARKPLSRTLLYKYLFSVDFGHFALHGSPITDFRYKKEQYGPVPVEALYYLEELVEVGDLQVQEREHTALGRLYTAYATDFELESIDLRDFFNDAEVQTIVSTSQAFLGKTAATASEESHCQYPWLSTPNKGYIALEGARHCTFEWLNYYGEGKDMDEHEETKAIRDEVQRNLKLNRLMKEVGTKKKTLKITTKPLSAE